MRSSNIGMADVVIVVGTKRGKEHVSLIEIKQMVGRAGRKHGGETALAHILVEDDRIAEVQTGLEQGNNMDVHSSFGTVDGLIFHLMPEIALGRVVNVATATKWYSRSLAFQQGKNVDFHKVFDKMSKMGAVTLVFPDDVRPTKIGKIAADLYFHPGDVQAWLENFTKLFEMGLENDNAAMAWALGTRTYAKSHGDFGDHRFIIGECKSALPLGLEMEPGTVTQVVLWWCAMGGSPAGRMRNQMLELRDDIGRIKRALVRIDNEVAGWNRNSFFNDLELMVRKGVDVTLVELCKLPGITKGKAEFLYNAGVRSVDGIEDVIPNISDDIDESFLKVLKEISGGISKQGS
jgi:replicative superfamily II helicase